MLRAIIAKLNALHGKKINLHTETHYLFMKDGVATIYMGEDAEGKGEIKVEVSLQDEGQTFFYEDKDLSLKELMAKGEL